MGRGDAERGALQKDRSVFSLWYLPASRLHPASSLSLRSLWGLVLARSGTAPLPWYGGVTGGLRPPGIPVAVFEVRRGGLRRTIKLLVFSYAFASTILRTCKENPARNGAGTRACARACTVGYVLSGRVHVARGAGAGVDLSTDIRVLI